jgi:uncharacterized membrane protein
MPSEPWTTALALLAIAVALALRPWRAIGADGPPWPWLAWWVMLPALWGADRYVQMPVAQPLSGACLLMLMCGWPLAVIALVPVALVTAWMAGLSPAEAVDRFVWLGLAPATLALLLGAAVRRWLPHHLMVYIFARGFFATAIAGTAAGTLWVWAQGAPQGLSAGDVMLGRWLASWGDAWLAGMLVAIFVAFRPQWLATYADRIYLPVTRQD